MRLFNKVRSRLAAAALAAVGAALASPAQAEQFDYSWVTSSASYEVGNDGLHDWFWDIYTFAVPVGTQVELSATFSTVLEAGVASARNLWSDMYVNDGRFVRFADASTSPVDDAGQAIKTLTHKPLLLGPGAYSVLVQGLVAGGPRTETAAYTGQLNFKVAAPVPEPAALAMMLGGLGVVGWAVRRKKRQQG